MNGMMAVPSRSGSNLPTLFRWCLGGMSVPASSPASASAEDADAGARVSEIRKELEAGCGHISASQEDLLSRAHCIGDLEELVQKFEAQCGHISASQADLLARAHFLGGVDFEKLVEELDAECGQISASQADLLARAHCIGGVEKEEEAEVFSTPPLTQEDTQRQGQSQRGQVGEGEGGIVVCTVPFTQAQPSSPSSASSSSSDSRERKRRKPRKPRVCTRKVRAGTKIWTPAPTPTPAATTPPAATETAATAATATTPPAATAPTPAPAPPTATTAPPPPPTATTPPAATATTPRAPTPSPSPSPVLDPLVRALLMVPTAPRPTTGYEDIDILELARSKGIF